MSLNLSNGHYQEFNPADTRKKLKQFWDWFTTSSYSGRRAFTGEQVFEPSTTNKETSKQPTSQTRSTFGTPRSTRYGTYRNGMMSTSETISSAKGTTGSNSPSSTNKKPTQRYYTAPRLHTGQYADRLRDLGFTSRDAIRDFQQKMIDAGYDLGKSGADGIWGNATEAAYQKYILPREMTKEELVQAEQETQPITTPVINWNQPDSNYKLNDYTARGNFQRYGDNTFVGYFNRDQGRAMHNQGASYIDRNGVTHDMGNMNRFQINRLARRERRADINALNNISEMNTLNSATAYDPTKNMTYTYQQGGKMNEQQLQELFKQFLIEKTGAKDEKELNQYLQKMDKSQIEQLKEEFVQILKQQQAQKARHGAKLNYIKQLKHQCAEDEELVYFKKGGSIGCGCVKKDKGGQIKKSAVDNFKSRRKQYETDMRKAKDEAERDSISVNKYNDQDVQTSKPGKYINGVWTPDRTKAPYNKNAKKEKCGGKVKKHQWGGFFYLP